MARYFTRRAPAKASLWVADDVYVESRYDVPTVCDHQASDTGLLDASGDPIMRSPRPIGFGRDEEW